VLSFTTLDRELNFLQPWLPTARLADALLEALDVIDTGRFAPGSASPGGGPRLGAEDQPVDLARIA
jgi:hypothetical protein